MSTSLNGWKMSFSSDGETWTDVAKTAQPEPAKTERPVITPSLSATVTTKGQTFDIPHVTRHHSEPLPPRNLWLALLARLGVKRLMGERVTYGGLTLTYEADEGETVEIADATIEKRHYSPWDFSFENYF